MAGYEGVTVALRHFSELGHPADLDPFDDEDVAVVIEARAVRTHELARDEVLARAAAKRVVPVRRVRVAQMFDDLVLPVDERDPPVEIGNDDGATAFVEVTGQTEPRDEVDVLTVHRESL